MSPTWTLFVGGTVFDIPLDVAALIEPSSVLSEALRAASTGVAVSVPRSADLFSSILEFITSGALPDDIFALRDLYVESAFWRLSNLRDAIEAALAAGGEDSAPAIVERMLSTAPLVSAVSCPPSTTFKSPHPTAMSAALAIARAVTVLRMTPPRSLQPSRMPTLSPPVGLSTSEYVGGAWRGLYENTKYTPAAAIAAQLETAAESASASSWSSLVGGATLSSAASRTMTNPNSNASTAAAPSFRESAASFDRAAAATALPDPFGFSRKRTERETTALSSTANYLAPSPPVPPRFDALAASISSLTVGGEDLRGCLSTLTALNNLLSARVSMRDEADGEDVGDGFHVHRSTQAQAAAVGSDASLSVLRQTVKIEVPTATKSHKAIDAARALLIALEEGSGGAAYGGSLGSLALSPEVGAFSATAMTTAIQPASVERSSLGSSSDLAVAATNAALAALRFGTAAAEAAMNALASPDEDEEIEENYES